MVKVYPPGALPAFILKPPENGQGEECWVPTVTEACLALRGGAPGYLGADSGWTGLQPIPSTPPSKLFDSLVIAL